jgi:hypothetical protein
MDKNSFNTLGPGLTNKHKTKQKMLAKDEHPSLFVRNIGGKWKKGL